MCISSNILFATDSVKQTLPMEGVGYKIIAQYKDSRGISYQSLLERFPFKFHAWLKDDQDYDIIELENTYLTGFHIYLTLKDAKEALKRLVILNDTKQIIVRVRYKKVTCIGQQKDWPQKLDKYPLYTYNCIVAREILLEKIIQ